MGIRDFLYGTLIGDLFGVTNPKENYVGERKGSKCHGKGTMTFEDGAIYKGQWKDNLMHGQGTFTYANGNKYEGEWSCGMMDGQGTLTVKNFRMDYTVKTWGDVNLPNWTKYEGGLKDNLMHGKGKLTYPDGSSSNVLFNRGELIDSGRSDQALGKWGGAK